MACCDTATADERTLHQDVPKFDVSVSKDYSVESNDDIINVTADGLTLTAPGDASLGDHFTVLAHTGAGDAGTVKVIADPDSHDTISGTGIVEDGNATTYYFSPNEDSDCCNSKGGIWMPEEPPAPPAPPG